MINFWTYKAKVRSAQIIFWEDEKKKLLINVPNLTLPALINTMSSGFQFVHWFEGDLLHGARYIPPGGTYPLDNRMQFAIEEDWEESENQAEARLGPILGIIP